MKHLGDITKIHGSGVHPVNVIIGGSPCQDLSVAGLRKGMLHEALGDDETTRSGLFMDQIRIVKELRFIDEYINGRTGKDIRPRYMVWENVPGAFSSNKGEDFRAVLEEIVKLSENEAPSVPLPDKGGAVEFSRMPLRCTGKMVHCLESFRCPVLGSAPATS